MPALAMTDQRGPRGARVPRVAAIALVVDRHRAYSSPTACANTSSSVGTLGRRWRTCTCVGRGEREQPLRAAVARHEHAHHVIVGGVALEPGGAQRLDERLAGPPGVFTRSSNTCPRGCFSAVDRARRDDATLVHDDDVVAGVFDVGQQVRRDE